MSTSSVDRPQARSPALEEGDARRLERRADVCPGLPFLLDSSAWAPQPVQESGMDFGLAITE